MPSQKSSAVAPKRARGLARVEALLEAASLVFAERGYDQATMTEIAARSDTAIGSLYRFFPTKESLGEKILQRFMDKATADAEALAARAADLSHAALADALIGWIVGSPSDSLRAGASAVLSARSDVPEIRRTTRALRRRQVANVLLSANPALGRERASDRAAVIVFAVKGERALAEEEGSGSRRWARELRRFVTQYIVEALRA